MALKKFKPTTPGQRQLVLVDRSELHKGKPVKGLTEGLTSKRGRTTRAKEKVEQYAARIEDHQEDLAELEVTLGDAIVEIDERWAEVAGRTEVQQVPLEKGDISVTQLALVWVPVAR